MRAVSLRQDKQADCGAAAGNCRRIRDPDGCVTGVSGSPRILAAAIDVDVKFWAGMQFEFTKSVRSADQGQRAVWTSRRVGQLCRAKAADAVAGHSLYAK